MKTILIMLGLTASQIQQRSNLDLDIAGLYDYDARYFRGPIAVRYQINKAVMDLPDSELVSVSFTMGILTTADITPHRKPLDGPETAKLCKSLEKDLSRQGFVLAMAKKFEELTESLEQGHEPAQSPPWRFGLELGDDDFVSVVIRPFESSVASPVASGGKKRYMVSLSFGNLKIGEMADKRMNELRKKYFLNRQGRIPLSEYPKE